MVFNIGAGGRTRTGTPVRARDFKFLRLIFHVVDNVRILFNKPPYIGIYNHFNTMRCGKNMEK